MKHNAFVHGFAIRDKNQRREPIYIAWVNMRQRCTNPNKWDYKFYGGRGIKVCEKWNSFQSFYKDMSKSYYSHKRSNTTTTLDRIDVNGGYEPKNCKWATRREQANNRNFNRKVTYNGITKSIGNWANELPIKITPINLYKRIYSRGWAIERAFTQNVRVW